MRDGLIGPTLDNYLFPCVSLNSAPPTDDPEDFLRAIVFIQLALRAERAVLRLGTTQITVAK